MKNYSSFCLLLLLGFCWSACSLNTTPKTKDISTLSTTLMVATMEEEVKLNNNVLYCPTVLLAWQAIQEELGQPFQVGEQYKPLVLLNNSEGHLGALSEEDYEKKLTYGGNSLTAKISFKADLALETPLEDNPNNLYFDNKKVACFGGNGKHDAVVNQVEMLYYSSPEEFAISISPKNKEHELLLYKTPPQDSSTTSLDSLYKELLTKIQLGEGKRSWIEEDELAIPALAFSIEKDYKEFKKLPFTTGRGEDWKVEKIWQKIALTFDKTGALVESEAEAVVSTRSAHTIVSRDLFFNENFLLVAKKKAAQQPYLLVWVSDPAFMTPRADK